MNVELLRCSHQCVEPSKLQEEREVGKSGAEPKLSLSSLIFVREDLPQTLADGRDRTRVGHRDR